MITDGPVPKHVQLRDLLLAHVESDLAPGAMIPSERELTSHYGVSRATVRAAIAALVADGLLQSVHGKGTVVTRPRVESRLHLASFTQDMRRRGHRPTTRVLAVGAEPPPASIAKALDLAEAPEVRAWRVERLRLADDEPMAHEVSWYPVALVADLDAEDLTGSVYALLESRYGIIVDSAEQVARAEPASSSDVRHLDVRSPAAVMVFERVGHAAGVPVEHTTSRYRGDRYQIQTSLDRRPAR